ASLHCRRSSVVPRCPPPRPTRRSSDLLSKVRAESVVSSSAPDDEEWDPDVDLDAGEVTDDAAQGDDEAPVRKEADVLSAVPSITPEPEGRDEPEVATLVPAALDLRSRGRCSDAFWESTPILKKIRECARAFHKSPEALLMNTCSILASYAPPCVTVSSLEGMETVSLNHGLVNIAGSGMGKSSVVSMAVKTTGTPIPVFGPEGQPDLTVLNGITTGEGVMDAFGYYTKEEDSPRQYHPLASRVRVSLDEIQSMLAVLQRPNNILGACLSSLMHGQSFDTPNAGTYRSVAKGTYRFVFVTNAQPTRLMTLLDTKDQGLAQRFFYVNAYGETD